MAEKRHSNIAMKLFELLEDSLNSIENGIPVPEDILIEMKNCIKKAKSGDKASPTKKYLLLKKSSFKDIHIDLKNVAS